MATVMIVDDAAFMRASLANILKKIGFQVIAEAENGLSAVKKFDSIRPDLVTMDITMPEMDGISALKEIIKTDRNAKVIMISALGQESYVREAILNGAKGFIVKPFHEDTILKTLDKYK